MADDCWQEFLEYQLLLRVLEEQSSKDKNGTALIGKNANASHRGKNLQYMYLLIWQNVQSIWKKYPLANTLN